MLLLLLTALALGAPLTRVADAPEVTRIRDVRVLRPDGTTSAPQDVVLADGLVAAVGTTWSGAVTHEIDGTGHTLMPGLIDLHVHLGSLTAVPGRIRLPRPAHTLDAFLYAGVTTVLDLASPREDIARWSDKLARGRWAGPRVVGAGKPFAAPGGHPRASVTAMYPGPLVRWATRDMAWEVADADDVTTALARQGITPLIKVMLDALPPDAPTISDDALARLRIGATALDARLLAHVGRAEDLDRAVALPVDALVHSPHHGAVSDASLAALAAKGIPVVATLAVWEATQRIAEQDPAIDPLAREILSPASLRDLARAAAGDAPITGPMAPWAASLHDAAPTRDDNVRRMFAAGVPILVGSDSPGLGIVAGAATHRELDLLVAAGLPVEAVLAAATWGNARFLDPEGQRGAVRVGYVADLLLVRGDPSEDLAAVHDIAALWLGGRAVTRRPRQAPP